MHPRVTEVLAYLDDQRAGLIAVVETVPPALASRQPSPGRWSAAQVVSHLAIVESGIAGLFRQRVGDARAAGLGPERDMSPILPTVDLERLVDRERALAAGQRSLPPETPNIDDELATLTRTREILRHAVVRADGLALGEVSAPHPFLGSLNLYQWLIFLGGHEARHTAQIREVARALTP
jgi:hypothetical protein